MTYGLLALGAAGAVAWWASVGDARREQGAMTREVLRRVEGVDWCGR